MAVRKLEPGQAVRVEHNAMIVGLADKNNPYFYIVEYPTGEQETVSLARINAVNDTSRAVCDYDGSIQVFSPRLSAQGGLDLLAWLRTHEAELQAAAGYPLERRELSTQLVCASCKQVVNSEDLKVHVCPTR